MFLYLLFINIIIFHNKISYLCQYLFIAKYFIILIHKVCIILFILIHINNEHALVI